jgi:hypothetical protein
MNSKEFTTAMAASDEDIIVEETSTKDTPETTAGGIKPTKQQHPDEKKESDTNQNEVSPPEDESERTYEDLKDSSGKIIDSMKKRPSLDDKLETSQSSGKLVWGSRRIVNKDDLHPREWWVYLVALCMLLTTTAGLGTVVLVVFGAAEPQVDYDA